MRQYECYELKFKGPVPDDFARVDLQACFELNGKETIVEGRGNFFVNRQLKGSMAWSAQKICISGMMTALISIPSARQSMR